MSAPTPAVRRDMYDRDHNQCVACGDRDCLTHQHRRAVGMGGSKVRPTITDSLTLCAVDNYLVEHSNQTTGLALGWKVRKWVKDPALVPVFYPKQFGWRRLTEAGEAIPIHANEAADMMRDVYGEEWDQWMEQVQRDTRNGLT